MKNIKKILALFVVIVLILGTLMVVKKGFNYAIEYKEATELKFMLGEVLDMNEVKSIVNKAFNNKEVKIQKIDYFNDSVNILVVDPTNEEIQTLLDKLNERYNQNNEMDNISRVKISNTSITDIIKPYILPSIVALALVIVYMGIKYKKQGALRVSLSVLFTALVVQALFFAIYAIVQIPITIWTVPFALGLLILTLTVCANKFEKNM